MKPLSREERKAIVKNELSLLKDANYISNHVYNGVMKAHEKFYENLALKEQRIEQAPETAKPKKQKKAPKIKQVRKRTAEEIRERNITWLLNLGVILLLIGGLYLATSNWETMSSIAKAGSIGLISLLFYGIAYISKRVLNIDKTAFSFIVLGSLFLPIFLLSIGWFQLWGSYLSIFGEGRYFFGFLSSFLVLPVYIVLARKLSSRLFVWFSYITLTIGTGFFLAALHLEEDGFFLGMMLFQLVLIYLYHRTKGRSNVQLFTKEFPYFAQLNLILTSILMLVLYHSQLFFGFNLMLTAVIYLAMVYVSGRKEFHFVFTAMIVYGAYQMSQFPALEIFGPLIFASLGFFFLLIPTMLDDKYPWKKIFTVTSGVVSGFAFLFITFEAILIRWGEPSFILLLAYGTVTANFLYLSNTTRKLLFRYLTAIFLSVSFVEGLLLVDEVLNLRPFILFVFLIGAVMFSVFGITLKGRYLEVINQPARDIGWLYMSVASYAAFTMYNWWELGIMLCVISGCAYVSTRNETRVMAKPLFEWGMPIALGGGLLALNEEWRQSSLFYQQQLGVATQFFMASIVLLAGYMVLKNKNLKQNFFYTAQAFYTFTLITSVLAPINEEWVRPLLFIGGLGMYYMLYVVSKLKPVAYLLSFTTLVTYFTVLVAIGERGSLQLMIGAVLLFTAGWVSRKKERNLFQAFSLVGHLYMPAAFFLTLLMYGKESIWSFLIGVGIYGLSTKMAEAEWKRKLFLYSGFTALFAVVSTGLAYFDGVGWEYAYIITSLMITVFWILAKPDEQKRVQFYLVPFSLLGVMAFITVYPYDMLPFVISVLYAVGILLLLHVSNWAFLAAIPTLLIYSATVQYVLYQPFSPMNEQLLLAVFGVLLLLAGRWFFPSLYEKTGKLAFTLDVYSIGALLFFATMYMFQQPGMWLKILPGLLIASTLWLQRGRIPNSLKWIPAFLAGAYLLEPYYALIGELSIHELLVREAYVLPFIVLGIYLQFCLKGRYGKITSGLQWAILIIVSAVLVIDGLETSTIYDALILGTLSLVSILVGVFLKVKSYFVIGTGVLLLNVFMQTRPFWGSLPWWAYLLIAGSILIGVASSNEWNKQKTARGEQTLWSKWKEKLLAIWKQWE